MPERTTPPASLNEVRDQSIAFLEEITAQFPDVEAVVEAQVGNVYACKDERGKDGFGFWITGAIFTSTDIPSGVESVREKYAEIETSYGTSPQDIEYADGSPWPVPAHHILLENDTGSYLLQYPGSPSGMVQTRTITACGELR